MDVAGFDAVLASAAEVVVKLNGFWLVDVEMPKPIAVVAVGWDPKTEVLVVVGAVGVKLRVELVAEGVKLGAALVAEGVKLGSALEEDVPNAKGFGAEAVVDCPNLKAPESVAVEDFAVSADLKRFTLGGADGFEVDKSGTIQNQQNTKLQQDNYETMNN